MTKLPPKVKVERRQANKVAERCPYIFEPHGSHIRQQCVREAGHPVGGVHHHHCGGLKK